MSDRRKAAIKIQKVVRGFLCRRYLARQSHCLEIRLKNIMPRRKPPVYRKRRRRLASSLDKHAIMIQKHIRGFLQRKQYKELFIEKMLNEQEEEFRSRIMQIEKELNIEETPATNVTPSPMKQKKSKSLYLELPLPMSQRRSPSKYRANRSVMFEYDYYILAAIEIQRVFRGFRARKKVGCFFTIRKRVVMVQRVYRQWKENKQGQLELAAVLMKKQCSILTSSFTSYNHLKSLILSQDRQGKYTKFIKGCEEKMVESGVNSGEMINSLLRERIKELENEKIELEQFYKGLLEKKQAKYKVGIREYMKGMKALKFSMDLAQKSNFEHISKIVKGLVSVSRDLDSESFYDASTFLPDVSFTDKSSINLI